MVFCYCVIFVDCEDECVGAGTVVGVGIVVGVAAGMVVGCVVPEVAVAGGFCVGKVRAISYV